MPPDLPNEQELTLKKRARRRLVGAIALVLLMIIVLPRILQDRANVVPQEAIKITMPEQPVETFDSNVTPLSDTEEISSADATVVDNEVSPEKTVAPTEPTVAEVKKPVTDSKPEDIKPTQAIKAEPKTTKPEPVKEVVAKGAETHKAPESFTVQVGVFSDAANVKQLQDKLKQAGFSSYTEKISTPGGEKIRLRAGKFSSRQEASDALNKIKQAGLSGMVITN